MRFIVSILALFALALPVIAHAEGKATAAKATASKADPAINHMTKEERLQLQVYELKAALARTSEALNSCQISQDTDIKAGIALRQRYKIGDRDRVKEDGTIERAQ